jgi:hypothetical protein
MTARTVAALAALLAASSARAADPPAGPPRELVVYPPQVKLSGPRDEQRLVVLGVWADGLKFDLTRAAAFTPADPKTVRVDATGVAHPVGDGSTTLAVTAAGAKASIPVATERRRRTCP